MAASSTEVWMGKETRGTQLSETEKLKRGVASDAERRGDRRRQDEEEEVV